MKKLRSFRKLCRRSATNDPNVDKKWNGIVNKLINIHIFSVFKRLGNAVDV